MMDVNSPPPPPPHPDTLVLSGGGPDGLAFVGCLRALEEADAMTRVRTVVGCSAGAIVALFVAAGLSSHDIETWASRGFADRSLLDADIEGVLSLIDRLGIDDGERVMSSIRAAVAARLAVVAPRLCAHSARAAAGDPTFLELAKATGRDLVVCVSNLEACERVLLSVDTAPNLGVAEAVRMSISIPLLFTPVRACLRAGGPTCTFVDGGLFDYCPVDHIVASGAATSTIAFRVSLHPPADADAASDAAADATDATDAADATDATDAADATDVAATASSRPSIASYCAMIARALLMRSCSTPVRTAAATQVRTVDVPSLMLTDGACEFNASSMSLEIDQAGLVRYVRHGMDAARAQLGLRPLAVERRLPSNE